MTAIVCVSQSWGIGRDGALSGTNLDIYACLSGIAGLQVIPCDANLLHSDSPSISCSISLTLSCLRFNALQRYIHSPLRW